MGLDLRVCSHWVLKNCWRRWDSGELEVASGEVEQAVVKRQRSVKVNNGLRLFMGIAFVVWVIDNVFYGGAMGLVPEGEEFFGIGEVGFGVHVEFFEDASGALVAGEGGGDDV